MEYLEQLLKNLGLPIITNGMALNKYTRAGLSVLFFCSCAFQTASLYSQDTVRICTYNLLKFSLANLDGRTPNFAEVLDSILPDILVCQELEDASAGPLFVSDVLTWAPFGSTEFVNGPDTDNMLFFNQLKFNFLSQRRIPTSLRDIAEFTLETIPSNDLPPDTVVFYVVHLKASDGTSEAAQRAAEIATLQANVTSHKYALICGDFNIYSPTETAYTSLLAPSIGKTFVDPLGIKWQRNNASFAKIYSQCTRDAVLPACGGGVDGGIDDRFDFILPSVELQSRIIPNSYTAFGNDGVPRLNASINVPPNTLVSESMAAALKCASDHLPVFCDILLGDVKADVIHVDNTSLDLKITSTASTIHCFNPTFKHNGLILIIDVRGLVVAQQIATSANQELNVQHLAPGMYFLRWDEFSGQFAIGN